MSELVARATATLLRPHALNYRKFLATALATAIAVAVTNNLDDTSWDSFYFIQFSERQKADKIIA